MKASRAQGSRKTEPQRIVAGWRSVMRPELFGAALLACAVLFTAILAAPELRINRVPLNDLVFHVTASERIEAGLEKGEPFLDPWVSEWGFGYPVWRSYQPLPHLVAGIAMRIFRGVGDPATVFAVLYYLLLISFPVSVYCGARLFGLSPPAAGLASLLVFAPSATGDLGRYGLGYGAYLWRGSGLYTQLFALHLMVIAVGLSARACDSGARRRRMLAALFLALTALSHIIFGYAAFVSAGLLAVVGPASKRTERLTRLVTVAIPALLLLVWFLVPLMLAKGVVNHSRWEPVLKWDSFGAVFILRELLSGRFLDFGRFPWLSALAAIGAGVAILSCKSSVGARRAFALTGLWLVLFFGRETWGELMVLAGVPADLPLHRLQAVFEWSACLLAAWGLARAVEFLWERTGKLAAGAAVCVIAFAMVFIAVDRAHYLDLNRVWGDETLAAYQKEGPDLEAAMADVRAILAEKPGRVYAGFAGNWGGAFKIGAVPVYAFLSRNHIDQASFLYHSMSKPSDIMMARDPDNGAQDIAFGIRAVVAPADRPAPPYLRLRAVHGRFAVYQSSREGYFGIVDALGHYTGPASTGFEPEAAWLRSPLQSAGIVLSLDDRAPVAPAVARWEPMPNVPATRPPIAARILSETKVDERYQATIEVSRPAYAFVKISWNPDLAATVDGRPASLIHVTPGFGAVALDAGRHVVSVEYRPGALKPLLLLLGAGGFLLAWFALGKPRALKAEERCAEWAAAAGARFNRPEARVIAVLVLGAVVALHPLFRGKLIGGHDSTAYPPRVVEYAKAVADGHIPPMWAPDLSAGHGQPVFEFNPPLVYAVALPFRYAGFGLTNSIQFGLALLHLLGALAVYGIGRHINAPRFAALGAAVAWLFGPYLCLDLFVRGAFAEAAAVAVAPVALLGLLSAVAQPRVWRIATGAGGVALLLLTHSAGSWLAMPFLAAIALVRGVGPVRETLGSGSRRIRGLAPLAAGFATLAGGVALAGFSWIPAMASMPNAHLDRVADAALNWSGHILEPFQLLWSSWGFGYSVAGPGDGISFDLGLAHLALAAAGLALAWRANGGERKRLAVAFAACAAAGAWLTCTWSVALWSHLRLLQYMQFPWRALVIPALFLPLLSIFALERAGPKWTVGLIAVLVAVNLVHTEPKGYLTYDEEFYSPESIAARDITISTYREYEPRWVDKCPPYYPQALVGLSGPIEFSEIARRTARQEYLVEAPARTMVESALFYYPGWTLTIDGAPAAVAPIPGRGTMEFEGPAGRHAVVLDLQFTPVRRNSLLVSLGLFFLLIFVSAVEGLRRRQRLQSKIVAS